MANPPSEVDIITILQTGTYNITFEFFSQPILGHRRHYPSIDVLKVSPESDDRTKRESVNHVVFKIFVYQRILSDGNSEKVNQDQAEAQILSVLESNGTSLENHRIIVENKTWEKERLLESGKRYYLKSTLTLVVREIKAMTMTLDGFLVFNNAGSSVDSSPGADYTYTGVYDVQISDGYRSIMEYVTSNPNGDKLPVPYAGGFNGRFIANIPVKKADIGTTGDKLNHLRDLRSNGEKPDIYFVYSNKTNIPLSPETITETGVKMVIDSIDRIYNFQDNVIYRIIGRCIKPSTITAA